MTPRPAARVPTRRRTLLAGAVLCLGGVAGLAACSTGAGASSDAAAESAGGGSLAAPSGTGDAGTASGSAGSGSAASAPARAAVQDRAVIRTGTATLEVPDVERARGRVQEITDTAGGSVEDEQSSADGRGRLLESRLVLRVPEPAFDDAYAAVGRVGDVVSQQRSSEDVTTEVIDTAARVRAQRAGLERVEALLGRAEDLQQVVALESELTRRQSDLDSLEQQRAYLSDRTSLATLTVYLTRERGGPAPVESRDGFLAGLRSGWDALGGATVAALTVAGALLPFVAVGVPLAWAGRLLLRRRTLSAR